MKRVLILCPREDTGGVGITLKRAFDQWSDWSARVMRRLDNYLHYPADIEWSGEFPSAEVDELYRNADVVHVMERPDIITELGPTSAKIVVHHLGSHYRSDPQGVSAQCKALGAVEVISADLDLWRPDLKFIPIPAPDLGKMARYRKSYRPSKSIRIAHAPTNRQVKSTAAIVKAVNRLERRYRLSFDLIENVPWHECLTRKAQADIYVDETRLGYGVNALECWGMGIPVISGIADPVARDRMILEFGGLPFFETTEDMLETTIEMLITDPVLRAEWGERGRQHVYAVHSPQAVVSRLIDLYEEVA